MKSKTVVSKLLKKLADNGFSVDGVYDGEEQIKTTDPKKAKEDLLAVDEAWLYVKKDNHDVHWISFVFETEETEYPGDFIPDWSFTDGDPDGFSKLMEDFTEEIDPS